MNPTMIKPNYKFATIPFGSTDTNIKINYPNMHAYMQDFNTPTVDIGVRQVKDGYVATHC